jgi:hypothetical protein
MPSYEREIETATIYLERGNAEPIQFNFTEDGAALNLTGKAVRFLAQLGSLIIRKDAGGSGFAWTDQAGGVATLTLTAAESRSLPVGKSVPFSIENYTDQKTLLKGELIGRGGVNDD